MMKKLMTVMMLRTHMFLKILSLCLMGISIQIILSSLMLTQCFQKICLAIQLSATLGLALVLLPEGLHQMLPPQSGIEIEIGKETEIVIETVFPGGGIGSILVPGDG